MPNFRIPQGNGNGGQGKSKIFLEIQILLNRKLLNLFKHHNL